MAGPRSFSIRCATAEDVDAFAAQRAAIFAEMLDVAGPEAKRLDGLTRAAFVEQVARGACLVWLAEASGAVVGSSALCLIDRLPSPQNPGPVEAYLVHVYVTPSHRRIGAGSALVNAAVEAASARGLRRVRLHATEPGRALYERLGFRLRSNDMELRLDGQEGAGV